MSPAIRFRGWLAERVPVRMATRESGHLPANAKPAMPADVFAGQYPKRRWCLWSDGCQRARIASLKRYPGFGATRDARHDDPFMASAKPTRERCAGRESRTYPPATDVQPAFSLAPTLGHAPTACQFDPRSIGPDITCPHYGECCRSHGTIVPPYASSRPVWRNIRPYRSRIFSNRFPNRGTSPAHRNTEWSTTDAMKPVPARRSG